MFQVSRFMYHDKGFTLIELLVIVAITGILTTLVTVNFVQLRTSQEVRASGQALISKIREVQNFVLSGQTRPEGTPQAYEITLTAGTTNYLVQYDFQGTLQTLETVTLTQNMVVNQILVGGSPRTPVKLRITSPFGQIYTDGALNQTVQVDMRHTSSNQMKSVVIDGISGRVSLQ